MNIAEKDMSAHEFQQFQSFVYELCGINLPPTKKLLLKARILKRMRALELKSYQEYYDFLSNSKSQDEVSHFIDVISTNKTDFFRESQHFDFLRDTIIPSLSQQREIYVWSAACSSGEEPLSIAMHFMEHCNLSAKNLKILATDISNEVLDQAEEAIYSQGKACSITPHLLQKYFQVCIKDGETFYKAKQLLTQWVFYKRLNLIEPFPLSRKMDVIFCRNVMIYFDKETQQKLFVQLQKQLSPGGYLFTGHSEGLNGLQVDLNYIRPSIYQKSY